RRRSRSSSISPVERAGRFVENAAQTNGRARGEAVQRFETIRYEEHDDVGWLTFSRPESLNAFNEEMSGELVAVMERLGADEGIGALVLRGDPAGRSFMAGADISMLERWSRLTSDELTAVLRGTFAPTMLERLPIPTIAAIDGFAFGMGCEVALGCDFR